jgi:hypothetical protein
MKTRLTLRPGQNGTKKLQQKYGVRLLAVRYRYDESRRLRLKTVELIEEEFPWSPPVPAGRDPNELVAIRIGYFEEKLRTTVKDVGATWQQENKTWRLSLGAVYALGLEGRLVE